uniref:Uncharacterized protein n=1 Tax=viral metagenome TaxID=1070528 RepID=A0A6M3KAF7_9ZZZZ
MNFIKFKQGSEIFTEEQAELCVKKLNEIMKDKYKWIRAYPIYPNEKDDKRWHIEIWRLYTDKSKVYVKLFSSREFELFLELYNKKFLR